MNPLALRLAAELGGSALSAPGGGFVLAERLQGHGLPQLLVLGRSADDLREPLGAAEGLQARGVALNVLGLVPLPGCDLAASLDLHRRRIGALVAALDAGLPWLDGKPMLVRRLPGRIARTVPVPLDKAPMGPLEKADLKRFLPDWDKGRRKMAFCRPEWREAPDQADPEDRGHGGFEADLWPGVPLPEGAELRVPPLTLPEGTALANALRSALREATGQPIPFLPLPDDPGPLHALRTLTLEATAFRGPAQAWEGAFARIARLPAPPHFCARC